MFCSGALVTNSLGLCLTMSAQSSIGVLTCSTVGPMCACAGGAGTKVTCAEFGPCCNTGRIASNGCAVVTGIVSWQCSCNGSCGNGGGGGGRVTAALGLRGSGSGGGGGGVGCGAS